jgi:hypothetical protein
MRFIVLVLLLVLVLGCFPIEHYVTNGGQPHPLRYIFAPLHHSAANSKKPAAIKIMVLNKQE